MGQRAWSMERLAYIGSLRDRTENGDGRPDTVGGRRFDGRVKGAMQLNASVMGVSR